jgi:hypothetical protein
MSVNLNEFSSAELTTLLDALAMYQDDIQGKIEQCDKWGIDRPGHTEELERVNLLVVQVMNAKAGVKSMEVIKSN